MRRVTKSRGGCARCKKQHLKCDEQKPSCGRCTRVGVVCPGYVKALKWSDKYELTRQTTGSGLQGIVDVSSRRTPAATRSGSQSTYDWLWSDFQESSIPKVPDTMTSLDPARTLPITLAASTTAETTSIGSFSVPLTEINNASDVAVRASDLPFFPNATESQFLDTTWVDTLGDSLAPDQSLQVDRAQASEPSQSALSPGGKAVYRGTHHSYVPSLLQDTASLLVEFYFKEPARLYSCHNGRLNPFVTTVAGLWQNSKVLFYSLQSMAAACLIGIYPDLAPTGKSLQLEALRLLGAAPNCDDSHLLSLLMIGGTTAWHDSKDIGLSIFTLYRQRLEQRYGQGEVGLNDQNYNFFLEASIFWELLLSFAADSSQMKRLPKPRLFLGPQAKTPVMPHPWTGFARDAQATCMQIGQLVRSQRKRAHRHTFPTQAEIAQIQKEISLATELEERLLGVYVPSEHEVMDPEDVETPKWHLLVLADIYKRVGLLQLYRVFPDLLHRRMSTSNANDSNWLYAERRPATSPAAQSTSSTSQSPSDDNSDYENDVELGNEWLTRFALRTLELIHTLPINSGTRDFQPFCLVACCSELRLPKGFIHGDASESSSFTIGGTQVHAGATNAYPSGSWNALTTPMTTIGLRNPLKLSLAAVEISRARSLLLNRLNSFLIMLPLNPLQAAIDIVKKSWEKLDSAPPDQDVYWVDIMTEYGWYTCLA